MSNPNNEAGVQMKNHNSLTMAWAAAMFSLLAFSPAAVAYEGGTVADGGAISGKIVFDGKAPATKKLKVTKDGEVCGQTKDSQELIVGAGGALKNVVVYIKKIKKGKPVKKDMLVLDQTGCVYEPHVMATVKGAKIELRNSDAILHNIHAVLGKVIVFNIAMPTKGQKINQKLRQAGLLTVTCDAGHTWMGSFIHVFDHPYFAVTGADGSYQINDLPPGDYELVAWHEKLGTKTSPIKITAKGKTALDLKLR